MKITNWVIKLTGLMKTLTKSQKRDFKKYVKFWSGDSKSERKYILLFESVQKYLSSGKEEAEILQYLLDLKTFGKSTRDITTSAQYLYHKILESMRSTPDASPYLNQLNAMFQDLIFLYNKNLFDDCREIIKKAIPLARALDRPSLELEWNFWAYRLRTWSNEYFTGETIADWSKDQQQLLEKVAEEVAFNELGANVRIYLRKKEDLPESFEERLKALLAKYEENKAAHLGLRAKTHLFLALSDYFDLKYSFDKGKTQDGLVKKAILGKSLFFQGLVLELYRSNKIFAEEEQVKYANIMDNYLNRCLRNDRVDLAEQLEADWAKEKNEFIKYCNIVYYKLQRFLTLNQFRQAHAYFESNNVAAGIEKYKLRIPESRLLALNFTAGQVHYALDDFDRAGDWFGVVARMKMEVRMDAVLVCKVLEIICLWEYGAFENDPDHIRPVRNLRRSLVRAKLANPFLTKILDAVEMVFRNARGLSKSGFPVLLFDIKSDYGADKTKVLFSMVLAWFDAKMNRTTVSREIVKY